MFDYPFNPGQAIAISPEPASPEPASPEPTSVLTTQDVTSVGITNLLFDMGDETNEPASELSAPVEENDNQGTTDSNMDLLGSLI